MSTIATVCAVILGCPESNPLNPCRIPLQLQTPARRCEDQQGLPIDTWPATFLCLQHGHACVCWPHNVHLDHEILDLGQPIPSLWKIRCRCAHEGCERLHTIYASREKEWTGVVKAIERHDPKVPCDGHDLVWREDWMHGEIAHNPSMR